MAVIFNKGLEQDGLNPVYSSGKRLKTIVCPITTTANNGDVVILAQGFPATAYIRGIRFPQGTAQIAGLTDVDVGLYANGGKTVIKKDAFADGVSFGAANTSSYDILGKNVVGYDFTKNISALASKKESDVPSGGYDLCMTLNTAAVGTLYCEVLIED